jgi:hypothetical protein
VQGMKRSIKERKGRAGGQEEAESPARPPPRPAAIVFNYNFPPSVIGARWALLISPRKSSRDTGRGTFASLRNERASAKALADSGLGGGGGGGGGGAGGRGEEVRASRDRDR